MVSSKCMVHLSQRLSSLCLQVDELLNWTTSLNYEDYVTSWKQIGTSSQSEDPIDQRRLNKSDLDIELDAVQLANGNTASANSKNRGDNSVEYPTAPLVSFDTKA